MSFHFKRSIFLSSLALAAIMFPFSKMDYLAQGDWEEIWKHTHTLCLQRWMREKRTQKEALKSILQYSNSSVNDTSWLFGHCHAQWKSFKANLGKQRTLLRIMRTVHYSMLDAGLLHKPRWV